MITFQSWTIIKLIEPTTEEIKKNDKEKIFYESHTRFRMGEHYEYWEKDEDLKSGMNNISYNIPKQLFWVFGMMQST